MVKIFDTDELVAQAAVTTSAFGRVVSVEFAPFATCSPQVFGFASALDLFRIDIC